MSTFMDDLVVGDIIHHPTGGYHVYVAPDGQDEKYLLRIGTDEYTWYTISHGALDWFNVCTQTGQEAKIVHGGRRLVLDDEYDYYAVFLPDGRRACIVAGCRVWHSFLQAESHYKSMRDCRGELLKAKESLRVLAALRRRVWDEVSEDEARMLQPEYQLRGLEVGDIVQHPGIGQNVIVRRNNRISAYVLNVNGSFTDMTSIPYLYEGTPTGEKAIVVSGGFRSFGDYEYFAVFLPGGEACICAGCRLWWSMSSAELHYRSMEKSDPEKMVAGLKVLATLREHIAEVVTPEAARELLASSSAPDLPASTQPG